MVISFSGLLHALTASIALAVSTPQDDRVEAHIALKNTSPQYISSMLLENSTLKGKPGAEIMWRGGIDEIVIKGKSSEVEEIRQLIRLLDVVQKRLSLEVRVVRIVKEGDKVTEEVLSESKMLATNNHPLLVGATDPYWESQAKLVPRINGDGTVAVRVWFNLAFAGVKKEADSLAAAKNGADSVARRLRLGETFSVYYPNPTMGLRAIPDWEDKTRQPFYKYGYRVEARLINVNP